MQKIDSCINTSIQPTVNFCSRNREIKMADGICRRVMREFPVYSNTKIERNNISQHSSIHYKLSSYAGNMVSEMRGYLSQQASKTIAKIKQVGLIKQIKVANCGEMADITYTACKMDKKKNVELLTLGAYNRKAKTVRTFDHTVVGLNFSEKSRVDNGDGVLKIYSNDRKGIIIDSWLGMTDYASNLSSKYKNNQHLFNGVLKDGESICYITIKPVEYKRSDIAVLKNMYPELTKKKPNIFERLYYKFVNKDKFSIDDFSKNVAISHRRNAGLKLGETQTYFE